MRITGNKPVTGVKGRGAKKSTSGGKVFTPDTGAGGDISQSQETIGGTGIQGIDALLALQEVDERAERKKKATRHGHSLLDGLDSMRAELLAGQVSEEKLEALANAVEARQSSGDAEVDAVLDEIELRVKVELAKLGRFPNRSAQ